MTEEASMEFIIVPSTSTGYNSTITAADDEVGSFKWSHANTLLFLDLYKYYRKRVGSLKIKNLKKMFEQISTEMQTKTNTNITPGNCENRWKHLERMYKKYIDNNTKTGRGRKDFEYAAELQEILGSKKAINPVILLSTETIQPLNVKENFPSLEEQNTIQSSATNIDETETITKPKKISTYKNKMLKSNILREIRNDRKEYYKQRLEIEEKKLREKIRNNNILKERNDILKQYVEQNTSSFPL